MPPHSHRRRLPRGLGSRSGRAGAGGPAAPAGGSRSTQAVPSYQYQRPLPPGAQYEPSGPRTVSAWRWASKLALSIWPAWRRALSASKRVSASAKRGGSWGRGAPQRPQNGSVGPISLPQFWHLISDSSRTVGGAARPCWETAGASCGQRGTPVKSRVGLVQSPLLIIAHGIQRGQSSDLPALATVQCSRTSAGPVSALPPAGTCGTRRSEVSLS